MHSRRINWHEAIASRIIEQFVQEIRYCLQSRRIQISWMSVACPTPDDDRRDARCILLNTVELGEFVVGFD